MSHFPKEFQREFIQMYKQEDCLWRIKSRYYHDREEREKSYRRLLKKVRQICPNATRDTVVKKIKNLRTVFSKEKRLVQQSLETGNAYEPVLWYYDDLLFLEDQEAIRPESNLPRNSDAQEDSLSFHDNADDNDDQEDTSQFSSAGKDIKPQMNNSSQEPGDLNSETDQTARPSSTFMSTSSRNGLSTRQNSRGHSPRTQTRTSYLRRLNIQRNTNKRMASIPYGTPSAYKKKRKSYTGKRYESDDLSDSEVDDEKFDPGTSARGHSRSLSSRDPHKRQGKVPRDETVAMLVLDKLKEIPKPDKFDTCGQLVAKSLREMSREQSIHAQKIIFDVLYEAQWGNLSRNSYLLAANVDESSQQSQQIQQPAANS